MVLQLSWLVVICMFNSASSVSSLSVLKVSGTVDNGYHMSEGQYCVDAGLGGSFVGTLLPLYRFRSFLLDRQNK